MKHRHARIVLACAGASLLLLGSGTALAQITPAEGYTPPDDTPKINVGITIFANYTYQSDPEVTDGSPEHKSIKSNSFDVTRAYINVTGNLSHLFAFRVTPDIVKETGSGTTLSGSQTYRLKYAYGQLVLDDWLPKGSWLRLGLEQTPYVDFIESIYRYRFQGAIFVDTEGFLTSSDYGLSMRFAFPANFGDIVVGGYNGDGYTSTNDQRGVNDQKAFQARLSIRPVPRSPVMKGLQLTGFYDADHYFGDRKRQRAVGAVTFQHPYINAGVEYLDAKDQNSSTEDNFSTLRRNGFSAWLTPRTPIGIEGLLRYDELRQNKDASPKPKKKRTLIGIAYWPPLQGGKSIAFLADYQEVKLEDQSSASANTKTKIFGLHTLWNF